VQVALPVGGHAAGRSGRRLAGRAGRRRGELRPGPEPLGAVVPEPVLTDAGLTALRAATPGHAALVRRMFFDALDPADLPALRAALERVHEQVLTAGTLPRPARHQHRLPGLRTED
jgi:hypothetical protein